VNHIEMYYEIRYKNFNMRRGKSVTQVLSWYYCSTKEEGWQIKIDLMSLSLCIYTRTIDGEYGRRTENESQGVCSVLMTKTKSRIPIK